MLLFHPFPNISLFTQITCKIIIKDILVILVIMHNMDNTVLAIRLMAHLITMVILNLLFTDQPYQFILNKPDILEKAIQEKGYGQMDISMALMRV